MLELTGRIGLLALVAGRKNDAEISIPKIVSQLISREVFKHAPRIVPQMQPAVAAVEEEHDLLAARFGEQVEKALKRDGRILNVIESSVVTHEVVLALPGVAVAREE